MSLDVRPMLSTTDHTRIDIPYLVTPFGFFLIGGVMALLTRGELDTRTRFLPPEQYDQLFTMHGTAFLPARTTPTPAARDRLRGAGSGHVDDVPTCPTRGFDSAAVAHSTDGWR